VPALRRALSPREATVLANWITLSRFPLLAINVLVLFLGSPAVRLAGVPLLLVGLLLDTVDGVVARKTHQTSLFGSVLDIAADRTYELVLWVCFAHFRLIPVAIPVIIIARTTLTDAFRGIGVSQGAAPFSQHRTLLAQFLVGSTLMRVGYSLSKIVAFGGLALAQALGGFSTGSRYAMLGTQIAEVGRGVAWVAVFFCVLRGLPVVIHGFKEHWGVTVALRSDKI
jgi:phosphatidylglycerophosphate synthase